MNGEIEAAAMVDLDGVVDGGQDCADTRDHVFLREKNNISIKYHMHLIVVSNDAFYRA